MDRQKVTSKNFNQWKTLGKNKNRFLPRDAMLAWHMLSLSVHLSVCLLQAGTVPKGLNAGMAGSHKQRYKMAQGL